MREFTIWNSQSGRLINKVNNNNNKIKLSFTPQSSPVHFGTTTLSFFISLPSALQQEVAETESQGDLALHLPPCNADADRPDNVYLFDDSILFVCVFMCKC